MTIWIVLHELNIHGPDESNCNIEGVYASSHLANQAGLTLMRHLRDKGERIYHDPDTNQTNLNDWTHDYHIESYQVLEQ